MTRGERIKQRRKELGLSQTDLAGRVGISKQQMYKYENDIITNIPSDKIELIASALHTTPAYIMGWGKLESELAATGLDFSAVAEEFGVSTEMVFAAMQSEYPEVTEKVHRAAHLLIKASEEEKQANRLSLRFALWGDDDRMDDADVEDVLKYAEFVRQKKLGAK